MRRARGCGDVDALKAIADSLLRARPIPSQGRPSLHQFLRRTSAYFLPVLPSTLRLIVSELWALEPFEKPKIAKYMRCLLQSTLTGPPDQSVAVMEDICEAVKKEAEVSHIPTCNSCNSHSLTRDGI